MAGAPSCVNCQPVAAHWRASRILTGSTFSAATVSATDVAGKGTHGQGCHR
jgi:hypothetical protein